MDRRIGPYRLRRRLGGGPGHDVWLAVPPGGGPAVVVKHARDVGAPSPPSATLAREVALLRVLDHPHLVPLLDVVGPAAGPPEAIVLPYLAGGTVRDLLDERGTLEPGELVALLAPVASALDALHRHGIVHGDVTPANVLLADDGTPVLADLGSARPARAPAVDPWWTPAYVDPILAAGGVVTPQADVYSLGVVAYEALAGRRPHRGESAEVLAAAATGVHRPLADRPGVAPDLAAVVEAALDPDPARRPDGVAALLVALAGVVDPASIRRPAPRSGGAGATEDDDGDVTSTVPFPLRPPAPSGPARRTGRARRLVGRLRGRVRSGPRRP